MTCNGTIHGDIPDLFECPKCKECFCDHKEQNNYNGWICADGYNLFVFPDMTWVEGSRPK